MSDVSRIFNESVESYDAWYDSPKGRVLLATEVECLRPLMEQFSRPYLEVGVGTGRFAEALKIEYGIDPSPKAIERARHRGVQAAVGTGEDILFEDGAFGGALMAFTLCFVRDPGRVMEEIRRVLAPGGGLVLGLLLKGTPWADDYARRGAEGHPLYSLAHFFTKEEVENLLEQSGFCVKAYCSTLFQPPGLDTYKQEQPVHDHMPGAGFVGIAAARA